MESDLTYFRKRASEERTAALNAQDARAKQCHTQLAVRYEDLVRGMAANDFEDVLTRRAKKPSQALESL